MGILHYEEIKLRQQEIEVRALVALAQFGSEPMSYTALQHLEHIAYPNEIEL